MKLEVFCLCDAATVAGGKLNILGAFDSLFANQIPAVHSQCAIALRMRFTRIEEGDHRIKITVVDEDGKSVMPALEGKMSVRFGAEDDSSVANFIINIQQLKLEKFGHTPLTWHWIRATKALCRFWLRKARAQA